MSQREPTEEEMRAAFEEEMKRISVDDVILQTLVTLVNLGGMRLGGGQPGESAEGRDLAQSRLAIDGARALLPLVPQETAAPIRNALSQLQMAYAREARAAGEPDPAQEPASSGPAGQPPSSQPAPDPAAPDAPAPEDAERARARAKIWTPPGT